MRISRRDMILSGLGLGIAFAAGPRLARANWAAPSTFGLAPLGGAVDQTAMLQRAIDAAAKTGTPLYLPPGIYSTRRLELRSGTHLAGMSGKAQAPSSSRTLRTSLSPATSSMKRRPASP